MSCLNFLSSRLIYRIVWNDRLHTIDDQEFTIRGYGRVYTQLWKDNTRAGGNVGGELVWCLPQNAGNYRLRLLA